MSPRGSVVLRAADLEGCLSSEDEAVLGELEALYSECLALFPRLEASGPFSPDVAAEREGLISLYERMGRRLKEVCAAEPRIRVNPFVSPETGHGEVSRLVAKLRDRLTGRDEFVYYTQRAFEILFAQAWGGGSAGGGSGAKNHKIVRTPVNLPEPNFAVHRIPDVDSSVGNTVMCVLLRGALLPSMILSKEIQEWSSSGYVTPFALFRIRRNDEKAETDMEYILDLDRSSFDPEALDGRDLLFADPMNATGGSLVAVLRYLEGQGVRPRSVTCFHAISALKGALRAVRASDKLTLHTLWMDPVLNGKAYIMPGLGDAGDRINGRDSPEAPRDIIRLIADYGSGIAGLYRAQIAAIEAAALRR